MITFTSDSCCIIHPIDIIPARFGHCIFIHRIRCLRRHPTMDRSRSSTHVYTATSSRIPSSYRSRSCVGTRCARGWAYCKSNGCQSSHGWLAQGQIAPSRCGAIKASSLCVLSDNPKRTRLMDLTACATFIASECSCLSLRGRLITTRVKENSTQKWQLNGYGYLHMCITIQRDISIYTTRACRQHTRR